MPNPSRTSLLSWIVSAALFVAMVAFWFAPVWLGHRQLAPMDILHEMLSPWRGQNGDPQVHNHFVSDAVTQYIPYRMFAEESLRKDGYLGWNPYVLGGAPIYANTMATPHDWTMQLHRWLPFWTAWHVGIAAQFLIAGLGMLVFLRSQNIPPPIALLGAVAFSGGSPFILWIYHRWALGSFCWMPWLLWALMQWRAGAKRFWFFIPFVLALGFLGGTLQHGVFVVAVVGCVWLAWLAEDWKKDGIRGAQWAIALAGIFAAALAAFSLLPATVGFIDNVQGGFQSRGGLGYPLGPLQPLRNAVSYLVYPFPWVLGSPQTLDIWKLFQSDLFNVCFFGFLPTALAMIGIWNRTLPLAARVLAATGLIIPLTPLVGPLYHRANLLFLLGGVWLVCVFLSRLDGPACRNLARILGRFFALASLFWFLVSLWFTWKKTCLEKTFLTALEQNAGDSQFGFFSHWLRERGATWLHDFPIWSQASLIPWLLAAGSLVCLYFWRSRRASLAHWMLVLIVFTEVTLYGARWVTFSDPAKYPAYPETPMITWIKSHVGNGRVSLSGGNMATRPFPPDTLVPYGIPTLQGYESIHPRYSIGEQPAEGLDNSSNANLGVSLAIFEKEAPSQYAGWKQDDPFPQFGFLTPPSPNSRYMAEGPGGLVPCQVKSESPNRREVEIPAGSERLLFVENWNAGWTATAAGRAPLAVEKTNQHTMAVPLTGNPKTVVLQFHPIWQTRGVVISLLAAALLAGLFLAGRNPGASPPTGRN